MGIFAGANKAELVGNRAPRLSDFDGEFLLKVKTIRKGEDRQIYYAADFEVVESDNERLKPGSDAGWAAVRDAKFPQYFFSDIKRFLASLAGMTPEEVTEEMMEASEQKDFGGLGQTLRASVRRQTKVDPKTQKPYGSVSFRAA